MSTLAVLLLGLGLPGILPAVAVAGLSAPTLFVVPLASALMAGTAAACEFALPGSFLTWFVVVAVASNAVAMAGLYLRGLAARDLLESGWAWAELLTVTGAVAWPLLVIGTPIIGYDTQAVWLVHGAMVSGGHSAVFSGLTDPQYTGNPQYPPLVPGAMAVGYAIRGGIDQHLAVVTVAVLNAAAVAVVTTGLLRLLPAGASRRARTAALLGSILFTGSVFGVGGEFSVNGYADVLWAVSAVGATVTGLVLPRSRTAVAVSMLCVAVASLTKQEGLVTSIVIAALIALRYARSYREPRDLVAAGFRALVPLVPGLVWVAEVHWAHIGNAFYAGASGQSAAYRLGATIPAMWARTHLLPFAVIAAWVGRAVLGPRRRLLGAGRPALVWLVLGWATFALLATYTFGALEIHWWLATSVNRTTIIINMLLLADLATWILLALSPAGETRLRDGPTASGQDAVMAALRPGSYVSDQQFG